MITCPFCENEVTNLKDNCHVVPRSRIKKDTKNNGKNVLIEKEGVITKNQDDRKGQFWCEECENASQKIDRDFGLFFHKEFDINEKTFFEIEIKETKDLKKFVELVILRFHLYELSKKGTGILGTHFLRLRGTFLKNIVNFELFPTYVARFKDLKPGIITFPHKTRTNSGINTIQFAIAPYFFSMHVDARDVVDPTLRHVIFQNNEKGRILLITSETFLKGVASKAK